MKLSYTFSTLAAITVASDLLLQQGVEGRLVSSETGAVNTRKAQKIKGGKKGKKGKKEKGKVSSIDTVGNGTR